MIATSRVGQTSIEVYYLLLSIYNNETKYEIELCSRWS